MGLDGCRGQIMAGRSLASRLTCTAQRSSKTRACARGSTSDTSVGTLMPLAGLVSATLLLLLAQALATASLMTCEGADSQIQCWSIFWTHAGTGAQMDYHGWALCSKSHNKISLCSGNQCRCGIISADLFPLVPPCQEEAVHISSSG